MYEYYVSNKGLPTLPAIENMYYVSYAGDMGCYRKHKLCYVFLLYIYRGRIAVETNMFSFNWLFDQ